MYAVHPESRGKNAGILWLGRVEGDQGLECSHDVFVRGADALRRIDGVVVPWLAGGPVHCNVAWSAVQEWLRRIPTEYVYALACTADVMVNLFYRLVQDAFWEQ